MESKGNVNQHHKNSEIDRFETWHIKNDTNWVMVALSLCWSIYLWFRSCNFHPASSNFPPSIPLIFFKLSIQHQPAITRIENWAFLPTQGLQFNYTLIRAFSKISAYTKTVKFYSKKNTSMNKFLAHSSSPCLMLGGIPPASLSEGWMCNDCTVTISARWKQFNSLAPENYRCRRL